MKMICAMILMLMGSAFADEMSYDTIGGKDYYTARVTDASGTETRWAAEFLENKDSAVIYKVDGEKMKAMGSFLLKVNFPATAQSFEYFVTSDKRPIFVMQLRDRVHDSTRYLYIFDPLKDSESERAQLKITSDDFKMKMIDNELKVEFYDAQTKSPVTKSWKVK